MVIVTSKTKEMNQGQNSLAKILLYSLVLKVGVKMSQPRKGVHMRIILAAILTFIIALLSSSVSLAQEMDIPSCKTVGAGIHEGFWVKHRILIGREIVYGADDLDSILSHLETLRNEGFCQ